MTGDQGPGDSGVVEHEGADGSLDERALDVPNCPACLHPMEAVSTARGGVHWACTRCGRTRIA